MPEPQPLEWSNVMFCFICLGLGVCLSLIIAMMELMTNAAMEKTQNRWYGKRTTVIRQDWIEKREGNEKWRSTTLKCVGKYWFILQIEHWISYCTNHSYRTYWAQNYYLSWVAWNWVINLRFVHPQKAGERNFFHPVSRNPWEIIILGQLVMDKSSYVLHCVSLNQLDWQQA